MLQKQLEIEIRAFFDFAADMVFRKGMMMKKLWLTLLLVMAFFTAVNAETDAGKYIKAAVPLNSGYDIPLFGISCTGLSSEKTENLVYAGLKAGFRLIEIGGSPAGEEGAGRGLQKAIGEGFVNREDIFLSVPFTAGTEEDGDTYIQGMLERLKLEYVDLMMLQQSDYAKDMESWQAMERASEDGKIRSLGLSGFLFVQNYDLFVNNAASVQPAVLKIPVHPYEQRQDMRDHLAGSGTVLVSDSPLGGKGEEQVLFADPVISLEATWYKKTSSQVILRWQLQSGNISMPQVSDEAQIEEYYQVLEFELSDDDMTKIGSLDRSLNFVIY